MMPTPTCGRRRAAKLNHHSFALHGLDVYGPHLDGPMQLLQLPGEGLRREMLGVRRELLELVGIGDVDEHRIQPLHPVRRFPNGVGVVGIARDHDSGALVLDQEPDRRIVWFTGMAVIRNPSTSKGA